MKFSRRIVLKKLAILGALVSTVFNFAQGQNVVAWGSNTSGQTSVPPSLTNAVEVAAGTSHSIARTSEGAVVCWGNISAAPPAATNVIAIASGANHGLALRGDGTVLAWGGASVAVTNVPANATNVIAIAAGSTHSLALRADGTVVAWGLNSAGQINVPPSATNIIALAAVTTQCLALRNDGTVIGWGAYRYSQPKSTTDFVTVAAGELGTGFQHLALNPTGGISTVRMQGTSPPRVPAGATNVCVMATGAGCSMALRQDGRVFAWGTISITNVPPTVTNAISCAAGTAHGLAVKSDGSPHLFASGAYASYASVGADLPLYARAVGAGSLSFVWFTNGVLATVTSNSHPRIPVPMSTNPITCQVVVSNDLGAVTGALVQVEISMLAVWGDFVNRQTTIPPTAWRPFAIHPGAHHNLALDATGNVIGWGKNTTGQASPPADLTNAVSLAGGSYHSLALRDDGTVVAWGRNWYGETNVPLAATNVVAVAAGQAHSLALRADGAVLAWGDNEFGQISVSFLATEVTAIAAGSHHNLALRKDGRVVAWGLDGPAPDAATNVVAIAAGFRHNLALRADGTILAWGNNTYGQTSVPPQATNIVAIAAGFHHNLALRSDGSLIAWGSKYLGVTNAPVGIEAISNIAAGEDHCAVLSAAQPQFGRQLLLVSGNLGGQAVLSASLQAAYPAAYQWLHDGVPVTGATNRTLTVAELGPNSAGNYILVVSNAYGQATSQPIALVVQPTPTTVTAVGAWGDNGRGQCDVPPGLVAPRAISAGAFHSLALQADGSVIAWGKIMDRQTNVPPTVTNAMAIAGGGDHSLALLGDGSVAAWGRNWDGQTNVPPTATNVVAIAAGWAHSCALKADGTLLTWGSNEYGQTQTPPLANDLIAVAAGYYHTLALRSDHRVITWGTRDEVPVAVSNVVAIAAGWEHSLALRADGTVVAWGDDSFGQCRVPVSATNIVSVSAGYGVSMAESADGLVFMWGRKDFGVTNVPAGLHNVAAIALGEDHAISMVELGPPRVQQPPRDVNTHVGGTALFVARINGTHPLSCQWLHDGAPITGATNQQLFLKNLTLAAAGDYSLMISNAIASNVTTSASLVIAQRPAIVAAFSHRIQEPGALLSLQAEVTGSQPVNYQWQLNGIDLADDGRISGALTTNLVISSAGYGDSGNYSLVANNAFGIVTGIVARVAVTPILAWGNNSLNQLVIPPSASNIVSVSAGGDHSLALRADGTVIAWGDNSFGQATVPAAAQNVVTVAAGGAHSLALLANGRVLAWGDNTYGQTNVPVAATNVVAIAAGEWHCAALRKNGTVIAWGSGHAAFTNLNVFLTVTNIVAIAAGENYTTGLGSNGAMVVTLGATIATNVAFMAGGGRHQLALTSDDKLAAFGRNYFGQTSIPTTLSNVVAIAGGGDHSVALRVDGTPVTWGANYYGQTNVPSAASNLIGISAGGAHTLAVRRTVGQPALVLQSPKSGRLGESAMLLATPSTISGATYQWQFNGRNLSGETNSSLLLSSLHWTNAGSYRLTISNAFGVSVAEPVVLTVLRTPLAFVTNGAFVPAFSSGFQARLIGASGVGPIVIYASSNLSDWTSVYTNPPVIGAIDFSDATATNIAERFFRAAEMTVPSPIQFAVPQLVMDAGEPKLRLSLDGLSATGPVTIYVSTNLTDWTSIFTNPPTIGPLEYFDANRLGDLFKFYRAAEVR